MKILHLMLSCFYIDNYNYQENILPRQNLQDGHSVRIIASTETFIDNQQLGYIIPSTYLNSDGIEVRRLPYRAYLPHGVMKKVRAYPDVYRLIEEFDPDVILFHGVPAYELLTVARYKRHHPSVQFYVDSHEDNHNSGTNFISKWILHRAFYRAIVGKALPWIDKVFYISEETRDFLMDNYGIHDSKLEFFPLGGTVFDEQVRSARRNRKRLELGLNESDILFLHSGKMDRLKRTSALLKAFTSVQDKRFRLVLIGNMPEETRIQVEPLIREDSRIVFSGWKCTEELTDYLCACDMYVQPGSQSATMQNALCTFAPVMLYPHKSHGPYLKGNGFFVQTTEDMALAFSRISQDPSLLIGMRIQSEKIAREILDYRKLAARLYR